MLCLLLPLNEGDVPIVLHRAFEETHAVREQRRPGEGDQILFVRSGAEQEFAFCWKIAIDKVY